MRTFGNIGTYVSVEMVIKMLKPFAYAMIKAKGGVPYERVERLMKDAAMIAFKDAVSDYERFHNIERY